MEGGLKKAMVEKVLLLNIYQTSALLNTFPEKAKCGFLEAWEEVKEPECVDPTLELSLESRDQYIKNYIDLNDKDKYKMVVILVIKQTDEQNLNIQIILVVLQSVTGNKNKQSKMT